MDVQDILDRKIKELPSGPHSDGLRAVKSHIEAAVRHFSRAQSEGDDTLFTDAIYRCNQAFEGSIKEAYRILAEKDPGKKTSAEIEQFLASGKLLRKKVLDQFTNYRRDWRNPATHDHTLDFDEDEALLAIVSVTVFAIVLCDQIETKIAFDLAAAATPATELISSKDASLLDLVTHAVTQFVANHIDGDGQSRSLANEYRLQGELAGHLASSLSAIGDIKVIQSLYISHIEAEIAVKKGRDLVIVDLRRIPPSLSVRDIIRPACTQVAHFLRSPDVTGAVMLLYSSTAQEYRSEPAAENLRIVAPAEGK